MERSAASLPEDGDRLSAILERLRVRAELFHTGLLCGKQTFEAQEGRSFLHILRQGEMELRHRPQNGVKARINVSEPTLLFYPRPLQHLFVNPPCEGSDFTCAALYFCGGERNPVIQSLPPLIQLPLKAVEGMSPTLNLLFSEVDTQRSASRLLADRIFEIVIIQLLRWIIEHPAESGVSKGLLMGLADDRLARALVSIHKFPDKLWTLEQLAKSAGMSRSVFAERFSAVMGTTPGAYVNDWRLCQAITMMQQGKPIKEIAPELGFSGAPAFSRAFSQWTGFSPREWLNRFEEKS